MDKYVQIQTTFEKREEAEKFAGLILDAGIAADGQIGEIFSAYNFEGKRHSHTEFLLAMKTRAELFGECEKFIKMHHPYKVPQIVATELIHGSQEYFEWISENTQRNIKHK